MTSAEKFLQQFRVIHKGGIGVSIVKTNEPYRIRTMFEDFSTMENLGFYVWTHRSGWFRHVKIKEVNFTGNDDDSVSKETIISSEYVREGSAFTVLQALEFLFKTPTDIGVGCIKHENAISLLFLPNFGIAPGDGSVNPNCVQAIIDLANELPATNSRVVLCVPPDWEVPSILRDSVVTINLDTPSVEELKAYFINLISSSLEPKAQDKVRKFTDPEINLICENGQGMSEADFTTISSRVLAELIAKKSDTQFAFKTFLRRFQDFKVELVNQTGTLSIMLPETISNVGGLGNLKRWLTVQRKCMSKKGREFGIDRISGCMIMGIAGVGKSLIAKAIGSTLNRVVVRFDVQSLFSKYLGGTEEKTRSAIKMIESISPCVLLIDEINTVFSSQGGDLDGGASSRVVGSLLTWMQETKKDIFFVMTANAIDNLPPQLTRKGRIDEIFSVTAPTPAEREEIIKIHLKKRNHYKEGMSLKNSIEASNTFVGAEIEAAVKEALKLAFFNGEATIDDTALAEQFKRMIPMAVTYKAQIDRLTEWAKTNAVPAGDIDVPVPVSVNTQQKRRIRGDLN